MSIIPKIKVGMPKQRDKHNLSFDCSTTANIGTIQPTMCREMVPNETFKVKVSSMVRLAPMPLPTFGRMSLRHYHCFVPYKDIYEPFDCLLSGQPYTTSNNNTFVPTGVPTFTLQGLIPFIMAYSDLSITEEDLNTPFGVSSDATTLEEINAELAQKSAHILAAINAVTFGHSSSTIQTYAQIEERRYNVVRNSAYSYAAFSYGKGSPREDDFGVVYLGNGVHAELGMDVPLTSTLSIETTTASGGHCYFNEGQTAIKPEGADLITLVTYTLNGQTYKKHVLFKFKPALKRLRQILIGLGYGFTPYSAVPMNFFKLIAYYKAWFELFRPKREMSWQNTRCYRLLMICNQLNGGDVTSNQIVAAPTSTSIRYFFVEFMKELVKDCYYYLPMDYFSMSVLRPQNNNSQSQYALTTVLGGASNSSNEEAMISQIQVNSSQNSPSLSTPSMIMDDNATNPLVMKMAFRLLTFANKNTVIGRSIRSYLQAHFGVSGDIEHDSSEVVRIGSQKTSIQINDVMANSASQVGDSVTQLGDYGGRGIGYNEGETFDFTAKKFGCWLTLTVIVPESGYYQGYLLENRHFNRFQWFTPEFDALGYQVLERGEIMNSYNCDAIGANSDPWNPSIDYKPTKAFGFVPRYSEYKVGRNIVNGDFSLAGRLDMAPYTLDRRISEGVYVDKVVNGLIARGIGKPSFVPSTVYDNFRRIDPSDHLGQYNRIFYNTSNAEDHFYIHSVFDVKAIAPFKSLSNSFDAEQQGENSMNVTHA